MVKVAFVVGAYPGAERERREKVALSYTSPGVEVGIVNVEATPYVYGLSPADIEMVNPIFIDAFKRAEVAGYDACVPLGVLDLGVDGGRCAVDIPVIGPAQAALHVAAQLGDRFGLIVYHDALIPMTRAIVRRYGMLDRVAGFRSSKFDLPDLAANHDAVVANFVAAARALIKEDGADLIIPMGISQCPVHIKPDWLMKELGVPVVDGIGAPIMMAALMGKLGLRHSRIRWVKQGKPF